MGVIDNVLTRFGDVLKVELDGASKLRIMASTFSIYAFEALRDELEKINELEFIFTDSAFAPEEATDRIRKEKRRFFEAVSRKNGGRGRLRRRDELRRADEARRGLRRWP